MKNPMISEKLRKQLSKSLLSNGEVLIQRRDEETNEPMFQVSLHIIKDKSLPTYGQPLFGLFGYHKGKCLLMCISYTKKMIMNEYYNFVPIPLKN